jgi:biopolymer transport protein ExbD
MRFTKVNRHRGDFEVLITSMLDINFLLIMFFMVTAHFQRESRANLDLPQEKGEAEVQVDEAGLVINVTKDGGIIIKNEQVPLEALKDMVRAEVAQVPGGQADQLKLMVRVDRNAPTGHLNQVVTMLREAGVGVIRVATEVPG